MDPLIEAWDIDLVTFDMDVVLNRKLVAVPVRRFGFVEREPEAVLEEEPGLQELLSDAALSTEVTAEEIEFLRRLRVPGKRPPALYYYRELQNLRDPNPFPTTARRPGRVIRTQAPVEVAAAVFSLRISRSLP